MQAPYSVIRRIMAIGLLTLSSSAFSQPSPPNIHMVYMGGNDCPPCVYWRATELPKLQGNAAFKSIRFSYVQKSVRSPVPSSIFLPDEVKPLKEKLDEANSGRSGSPQVAVVVNGEIYDYYRASRSAEQVEQMIVAIKEGGKYPFKRCVKLGVPNGCAASN